MRKKSLEKLIDSIQSYTTDYELLIHDEGEKHLSVAEAWNEQTKKAQGEFLQYLNDDMEVTKHWLEAQADAYEFLEERGERVGCLQSCIWCDGMVQTRGGAFHGTDLLIVPPPDILKQIDYSNMPFMRRSVYDKVGGFKAYDTLYYDDTDFGLRCIKMGYTNWYNPYSNIYHDTLGQKAEHGEEEVKRRQHAEQVIQGRSRELFMVEWKEWLENEHKNLY